MVKKFIAIAIVLAATAGAINLKHSRKAFQSSDYTPNATVFASDDQSSMERDGGLTGGSDDTEALVSVWLDWNGDDATFNRVFNSTARFTLNKESSNKIRFQLINTSGTVIVRIDQDTAKFSAITASTGWVHVLCSVKNTSAGGYAQMYINDTECATLSTFLADDTNADFTEGDYSVGDYPGQTTAQFNGEMADLYINMGESLDLTTESNRRLFIDASGNPVDLGSDGSTPTGTSPIIFFKSVYSSFTTNSGTGGNFVKKGTTAFAEGTPPP